MPAQVPKVLLSFCLYRWQRRPWSKESQVSCQAPERDRDIITGESHPCSGSMNSLTSPMLGWSGLGLREGAERVYMLPLLRSPTVECSAVQGSCTRPGADRLAV